MAVALVCVDDDPLGQAAQRFGAAAEAASATLGRLAQFRQRARAS